MARPRYDKMPPNLAFVPCVRIDTAEAVEGVQLDRDFSFHLPDLPSGGHGGGVNGKAGTWLVRFPDGSHGVFAAGDVATVESIEAAHRREAEVAERMRAAEQERARRAEEAAAEQAAPPVTETLAAPPPAAPEAPAA